MNMYSQLKVLKIAAVSKYKTVGARFLAKLFRQKKPQYSTRFEELVFNRISSDMIEGIATTDYSEFPYFKMIAIVTNLLGGKKASAQLYKTYKKEIWELIYEDAEKNEMSVTEVIMWGLNHAGEEQAKNAYGLANLLVGMGVYRIADNVFDV